MAGLILKLRAHEQFLVNGVVMQNGDRSARLIVKTAGANILRLRDAIHPDEVDTPVKRVCYVAQLAVAGEAGEDEAGEQLLVGIEQLEDALEGFEGTDLLCSARDAVEQGNFYAALKALRGLLPIEEALLARFPLQAHGCASGSA